MHTKRSERNDGKSSNGGEGHHAFHCNRQIGKMQCDLRHIEDVKDSTRIYMRPGVHIYAGKAGPNVYANESYLHVYIRP